jgi:sporulation protein YlmC with PRC-barrel domain
MTIKLSQLYGMSIYRDDATYIGKVQDIILNLETGEIVRLITQPLRSIDKESAKKILREKSVLYKNVKSVRDIIIVSQKKQVEEYEEPKQKRKPTTRQLFRFFK